MYVCSTGGRAGWYSGNHACVPQRRQNWLVSRQPCMCVSQVDELVGIQATMHVYRTSERAGSYSANDACVPQRWQVGIQVTMHMCLRGGRLVSR